MGSGVSGEPLSPYFLVFIFQVKLSLENFLYSSSLTWSFFLGSQGKVLDHFHNKMNISDSPLWLCNENSHEQKVRKLGLGSSFLSFRVPSVGLQGPICRSFTILSFYSIFKNPIWAHNIWELRQDSLGETANTRTQATRTAVGSLLKKKKKSPWFSICQQSHWPLTVDIHLFPSEESHRHLAQRLTAVQRFSSVPMRNSRFAAITH